MASEGTQVPIHESHAAPPKAPEDASGIKPTDDKPSGQPAVQMEPTKLDEPATNTAPVGTVADGAEQQKVPEHGTFLKEKTPPPTSGPGPTDASNAQAAEPAKESVQETAKQPAQEATASGSGQSAPPAEDHAAKALNGEGSHDGTQKDVDMRDAVPAPEESVNAPAEGALKRKAEDEPAATPANGDNTSVLAADAKKAKTDTAADPVVPTPAETNGHGDAEAPAAKKPGRPKKEKKEPTPVGKTARRTRSQGPLAA